DPGEDEDDADAFILNGDEDAAEVRLLASDAGGFVIDLHLRGLKVEVAEIGGETFHVLTVSEKATTIEVGRPEIPVVSEVIAVPAGARIRATVIKSSYSAYPGYRVRPFQPPEVDCDPSGEARPFVIDEEFYSQDAFYPRELVVVGAPGTWRDLDVVELQMNPVAFNPASGELRVYDHLRVRIDYEGATLEERRAEPKFSRMYRDVILNYDALDLVVAEAKASERELPLIGDAGIDGPRASSDLVKYLSIRHEGQASYESVSPLLEMRAERGLPFVSYSFPSSSTPSAADVKEVIAAVYGSHPELEYVLIVGDIDRLPWNSDWGGFPGDYWYGCIAGDDLYPEVAVGRISAEDDGEVVEQVNKILSYEMRQPSGGWRPKVLLVAHAQDAPGKYQGCKESIRTASYARPFVFETAYGANPAEGGDGANNADVMLAIDSGVGIVNYRGHGGYTYWGSGWNYAGESYGTAEAHALEKGLMTPIIFSIACYNAALDHSGECLGEAFVKDDGSAVAFIGASRPSWTVQ
ncbi:MAG: C25 family cysteine peptidase, partial [Methanothrix sp.]|nr:C25 family cysteine peptidase [Methanothrix sp.]